MKRFVSAIALLAVMSGLARSVDTAPPPREKPVVDLEQVVAANLKCCGLDEPPVQPAPVAADGPKLGRAIPEKQFDYGNYRVVVTKDGKVHYFPRLGKHIDPELKKAPLPEKVNYGLKAPNVLKKMYLNNQYGDCVIASRYHAFGIFSANALDTELFGTDAEVLNTYRSFCGGGDNGCNMASVNQLQQTRGITIAGKNYKIDGAVSIDNTQMDIVKTAVVVFGNVNIGMSLPRAWYQSADGSDWGPTSSPSVGGHEVQAFGYDDKGVWIATWGGTRRILWPAFTSRKYIDETYTSLAPLWYQNANVAPNGIDVATLKADLAAVANGQVPPLPDPVPPTPVPPTPVPPTPVPPTPVPPTPSTGNIIVDPAKKQVTVPSGWTVTGGGSGPIAPPGAVSPSVEWVKNHAAKKQARKDGAGLIVSAEELKAARAKVDAAISDSDLSDLLKEKSGAVAAGPLGGFLQWIIDHQAELESLIALIMKLIALFGQIDLPHPDHRYGIELVLAA